MKLKTAINHQQRFKTRVYDIFMVARIGMCPFQKLLDRLTIEIYNDPVFKRCPVHVTAYIRGIIHTKFDELYEHYLISAFMDLETGNIYYHKYPVYAEKVTFYGHCWINDEQKIIPYSIRSMEELEAEKVKRGIR